MNSLDHLWAGWRKAYVADTVKGRFAKSSSKIFTQLAESNHSDNETFILYRGKKCFAILNIFPYSTGHTLILPHRQVRDLEDLEPDEFRELWEIVRDCTLALKTAYSPTGINIGSNLGKSAGAGIPDHLHIHCLPRWDADTNFMTSIANTKVLPEPLDETWQKLKSAWPQKPAGNEV